jgi:hypothetical protein
VSLLATEVYIYIGEVRRSVRRSWALSCIVGFVVLWLIGAVLRFPFDVSLVTTGFTILLLWWFVPAIARKRRRSVVQIVFLSALGILEAAV